MEGPTIAVVTILELNGDPYIIKEVLPDLEGDPPARLQDTTDEEEFKPILDSGERNQDCCKGRDGRFFSEGIGDVREVL